MTLLFSSSNNCTNYRRPSWELLNPHQSRLLSRVMGRSTRQHPLLLPSCCSPAAARPSRKACGPGTPHKSPDLWVPLQGKRACGVSGSSPPGAQLSFPSFATEPSSGFPNSHYSHVLIIIWSFLERTWKQCMYTNIQEPLIRTRGEAHMETRPLTEAQPVGATTLSSYGGDWRPQPLEGPVCKPSGKGWEELEIPVFLLKEKRRRNCTQSKWQGKTFMVPPRDLQLSTDLEKPQEIPLFAGRQENEYYRSMALGGAGAQRAAPSVDF